MLKKIFNDIGLTEILGFVVLCLLLVFYYYFNPSTIRESEIQVVHITLSEKPIFSPSTAELSPYLKLIDNNYEQPFKIEDCSLKLIDKFDILKLKVGDKLRITAKTNELNSGKTFINNYISVYGIQLQNGVNILNLENYNSCKKNDWESFIILGGLFIIILVINLIKKPLKK